MDEEKRILKVRGNSYKEEETCGYEGRVNYIMIKERVKKEDSNTLRKENKRKQMRKRENKSKEEIYVTQN